MIMSDGRISSGIMSDSLEIEFSIRKADTKALSKN